MKSILKNVIIFVALSVVFSNLTACSNNTSKINNSPVDETSTAGKEPTETKSNDFPPVPAIVAQTEIKTLDGSTFKIEDKKGKVILLNLWATWCGPCRAEMPELVALQDKYRDQDFEIVGLNTDDESAEAIKSFADKMNLNYTMAWTDGKMMSSLLSVSKFDGIPQSFMIDREGKLRNIFVGGGAKVVNQLKEAVEKVVNE